MAKRMRGNRFEAACDLSVSLDRDEVDTVERLRAADLLNEIAGIFTPAELSRSTASMIAAGTASWGMSAETLRAMAALHYYCTFHAWMQATIVVTGHDHSENDH